MTQQKPDLSSPNLFSEAHFELIPLKNVDQEAKFIPPGSTVAVTASPKKSLETTLTLSEQFASQGFRMIPHIAARMVTSHEHLQEIVKRMATNKFDEVFVIGGDSTEPMGPYHSASTLLADMTKINGCPKHIGVGCYPEGHYLISKDDLFRSLQEKQAYAHYMVTQICFDAAAIKTWLLDMRKRDISLPIYIGIPGVLKRQKLLEISLRLGIGTSTRFLKHNFGLVTTLLKRDMYTPDKLVSQTLKMSETPGCEIAGFHIYTFNQCQTTVQWTQKATKLYSNEA
jgi:methylenetetrahydrofolate reductase (NADPH)